MAPLCGERLGLLGLWGLRCLLLLGFVEGILVTTGESNSVTATVGGPALSTVPRKNRVLHQPQPCRGVTGAWPRAQVPAGLTLTSACTLQNSASLVLFTSQLMTRTSGRHRMLRVCTCIRKQTETKEGYVCVKF